jgi:ribosomal protein S18 acetylase RimI-like enzyme
MTIELLTTGASPERLTALEAAFTELHAGMRAQGLRHPLPADGAARWLKAQLPMLGKLCCVACAWEGDVLLGFCAGMVRVGPAHLGSPRTGAITHIHVAPAARGRGLGRALFEASAAWFREKDLQAIELEVLPGNAEGRAFWDALGFGVHHVVMHRSLD